jgi:hypothetical protein
MFRDQAVNFDVDNEWTNECMRAELCRTVQQGARDKILIAAN